MNQSIDIIENLFLLLKNHKYNEFKSIIKNNKYKIDLNIPDYNGNYLLTYAVRFNNIDIVKLLLNYESYYDISDKNDRLLINDAIDNGFNDIVKLLVEHSENNIGQPLIEIRDAENNYPLIHSIQSKNMKNQILIY